MKFKGVSYAFNVCDIIEQHGEKWIRETFDSIKNQSDDIIVIDYNSNDNIKEIAEEYGFRFFRIEKTNGLPYHDAKMWNKAIHEAKYDIFMMLQSDAVWDKNLTNYILKWYEEHDYKKNVLTVNLLFNQILNGKFSSQHGYIMVYYRPFLLKVRGTDERTYMGEGFDRGTHRYSIRIMFEIFNLKRFHIHSNSMHRAHPPTKFKNQRSYRQYTPQTILGLHIPKLLNIIKKTFNLLKGYIHVVDKLRQLTQFNVSRKLDSNFSSTKMINEINKNFDEGVKQVINSYW